MATLLDYTHTEFPNHTVEVWRPDGWTMPVRDQVDQAAPSSDRPVVDTTADAADPLALPLADHTVVAHVIGADAAVALLQRLRAAGWIRSAAVLVCPAEPSVMPSRHEDRQSAASLPDRRWLLTAAIGAVFGGLAVGLVAWIIADAALAGVIAGGFGAVLGAVVGAMLGGLGRHAGDRAWSQPHAPGRTMGVVATFADDERRAVDAVRLMEGAAPHELRLVNSQGAWRVPSSAPVRRPGRPS